MVAHVAIHVLVEHVGIATPVYRGIENKCLRAAFEGGTQFRPALLLYGYLDFIGNHVVEFPFMLLQQIDKPEIRQRFIPQAGNMHIVMAVEQSCRIDDSFHLHDIGPQAISGFSFQSISAVGKRHDTGRGGIRFFDGRLFLGDDAPLLILQMLDKVVVS